MELHQDRLDPTRRAFDHELNVVRSAIAMVGSGCASRILLAGLGCGERLVKPARRIALEAGVRIVPERSTDGTRVRITIESIQRG